LLTLEGQWLSLRLNAMEVLALFAFAVPAVCGIANIMLANNICDVDDDMENKRYTLPIYIGKEKALWLFETLYYIAFVDIIILAVFRIVSPIVLLTLLVFIPVRRNIGLLGKSRPRRTPLNLLSKICGDMWFAIYAGGYFRNFFTYKFVLTCILTQTYIYIPTNNFTLTCS